MAVDSPKTGAVPTPKDVLAGATPYIALVTPPENFIRNPSPLSSWGNDVHQNSVIAEEAFAKLCFGVFVPPETVIDWATRHNVLGPADPANVMNMLQIDGFNVSTLITPQILCDGPYHSVDWKDSMILRSAIFEGPVKIGVASTPLWAAWNTTRQTGWFGTGFRPQDYMSHCASLCGYGTIKYLAEQLKVVIPVGIDETKPGYAVFSWGTIGIVDESSMRAITSEAWLRRPTTVVSAGPWQAAFQSKGSTLWVVSDRWGTDIGVAMVKDTSPSIAAYPDGMWNQNGGWAAAYQGANGNLWVVNIHAQIDTAVSMATGASPSITATPEGGWLAACQDSNSKLTLVREVANGAPVVTDLGVTISPGTRPSIAAWTGGQWKVAFSNGTGNLCVVGSDQAAPIDTGYAIMRGTSPSIAVYPNGDWSAAYQSADTGGPLWIAGKNQTGLGLRVMAGTSPSIAVRPNGDWQVAFQDNSGKLWTAGNGARGHWDLGMMAGTSPSIAMRPNGDWQVAFQDNQGKLWIIGTGVDGGRLDLNIEAGTSPCIA